MLNCNADMDKLTHEIQIMRAGSAPTKTAHDELQFEMQQKDMRLEELAALNEALEGQVESMHRLLDEKENEIADERAISDNVRQCLETKFAEDRDVGEDLRMANETIHARDSLITLQKSDFDDHIASARLREQGLESLVADRDAEVASLKEKLQSVAGDVQTSMADLKSRLDHIIAEKLEMQSSLQIQKERCLTLEHELREKSSEMDTVLKDFSRVVESVQFYNNRLDLQADTLTRQTEMWFDSFEHRVQAIHSAVHGKHSNVCLCFSKHRHVRF
jgi:chromosome segregation ATPase